ncbi:MAG: hypothetical protein E6Q93_04670 [Burkholderiaceae bacterium]|nr:MAG: hypothetical protein E6Q93_04670 [Burkholderiaceae bacterium]
MSPERRLGVCAVVHAADRADALAARLARLQRALGRPLAVRVGVAASSPLQADAVAAKFAEAGLSVDDCRRVDDTYFDFSAYGEAAQAFDAASMSGMVFVNDTLVAKHDSPHLLRQFASRVREADALHAAFPMLVGPYRQSEFSVGDGRNDEFVSTFLFHLNASGVAVLRDLVPELAGAKAALEAGQLHAPGLQDELLRLCSVHALQVRHRYLPGDIGRLACKLATAYVERRLSQQVRAQGLVWYVAGGMLGRLLVPLQLALGRVLRPSRGGPSR